MELSQKEAELLENNLGYLGFDLHKTYSGRGMYNKHCFGFTTSDNCPEMKLIISLAQDGDASDMLNLLEEMADCGRTDSLGKDKTIYYYPNIQWPEDEEIDDDEEDEDEDLREDSIGM